MSVPEAILGPLWGLCGYVGGQSESAQIFLDILRN